MAKIIFRCDIIGEDGKVKGTMLTESARKMKQLICEDIYAGDMSYAAEENTTCKKQTIAFKAAFDMAMRPVSEPEFAELNANLKGAKLYGFFDGAVRWLS